MEGSLAHCSHGVIVEIVKIVRVRVCNRRSLIGRPHPGVLELVLLWAAIGIGEPRVVGGVCTGLLGSEGCVLGVESLKERTFLRAILPFLNVDLDLTVVGLHQDVVVEHADAVGGVLLGLEGWCEAAWRGSARENVEYGGHYLLLGGVS